MNKALLKKEIKSNYKLLLIFMAVLTMYSSMIISMFDPKLGDKLNAFMETMPDVFSAFGMTDSGSTLIEFMGNYLYGFLYIAFPAVFIIILSNKLIARYIDRGSMAYLLSAGNKRRKIAVNQAAFMIGSVFVLVAFVTALCIGVSNGIFPKELNVQKLLVLNTGLFGLLMFLSGLCFFICCVCNDAKHAVGISSAFTIGFLLVQMVSQAGEKFDFLKYCNPLSLFDQAKIIAGETAGVAMFCTLYGAGILLFAIGIICFNRRDLSI